MRILVVDDSALYRKLLTDVASSLPDVEAVAVSNGEIALKKIDSEKFDLVLLDVFMDPMSGPQTLVKIKESHPHLPVVMVSGATGRDAEVTLGCLSDGAMDFIPKPSGSSFESGMESLMAEIRRVSSMARLKSLSASVAHPPPPVASVENPVPVSPKSRSFPPFPELILIGVSTGGPNALSALIPTLSQKLPVPILLVQHMPPFFTKTLAEQLNKSSSLSVAEAQGGEIPGPGEVLIAPGGYHMEIVRTNNGKLQVRLASTPPVNSCRPAVDVLFNSAAKCELSGVISLILTGMGSDGADGVASLRAVCPTWCIAQDAATSTVYGMPQAIAQRNLADEILSLQEIGPRLNKIFRL